MDIVSSIVASRIVTQQRSMEVVADNLANANTPGFKAQRMQFSDWLSRQDSGSAPPGGGNVAFVQDRATWREQQQGTITHTSNPFDLALTGDGYFTVNTPRGPRLTRNGRFGQLPNGTIADAAGNPVLDTNGKPILLATTDTQIAIAGDGTVSSENGQLGKIGVVAVANPQLLTAEGAAHFTTQAATSVMAKPGIEQGAVEDSNVATVMEVTRMTETLRQFQFMSQFIQAEADRHQAAIDKLLPLGA